MNILVLSDHDNAKLFPSTLNAISAAKQFNGKIIVLVAGFHCQSVVGAVSTIDGVDEVWVADHAVYQHPLAERFSDLILHSLSGIQVVMASASSVGKSVMPRVAALSGVGQVSDVIEIIEYRKYKRPVYAGNAIAAVDSQDELQILTVRSTSFEPAKIGVKKAPVVKVDFVSEKKSTEFLGLEAHSTGDRPDLGSADIVISGGRGLQNKATFEALAVIADKMNAAIGASRAAVDAGLAPNDWQVGQTGQIVAPSLYFAVGISGAIQHLAGMKDSKVIVAINKDPEAPIFQIADYGIVADLNEVLPEWSAALDALSAK